MADPRLAELQALLPRCMLPDWVRLGSRLVRLLRDRRHAESHDALLDRFLEQAQDSIALREERAAHVPQPTFPENLPICTRRADIVEAIRRNQVVVIAGETGSGKTTQIPKMCLEAGLGIEARIGCTQPRRVAALSISRRIAEELQVGWGREVGCKIRFDDRSSPATYIKLMTDGILLAEAQGDPLLSEYNAIIIDEAHERSLNIDFLLGHLKGVLTQRRDLKLIITSATIDTQAFSRAFDDAPIIEVSGRLFPVEVRYEPLDAAAAERGDFSFIDGAVRAVQRVLDESSVGDVLVFLPGERDIREATDQLDGRLGSWVEVVPLFGRLSSGDQQRVFAESSRRRVIVATNIAETSLTLPGIRYVVDSGLARISRYNARTRTKRLPVEPVSQSSANQRKGRAGRVQDGICIRLYSEEDFQARPAFTQPEIQRANLAEVILRMRAFRLGEIETFPFVNPPAPAAIQAGYQLLQELGALDAERHLTDLGRDLARLPIDPTLGRMLIESKRHHAVRELLIIAAGLSIQDPRERPLDQRAAAEAAHRKFTDPRSDFLTLLRVWDAVHDEWETLRTQNQRRRFCKERFLSYTRMIEWQDLHSQLAGALGDLGSIPLTDSNADYDAIHRSILSGLLGHVAARHERNVYRAAANRLLQVFPGSVLHDRGEKPVRPGARNPRSAPEPEAQPKTKQPAWVVAGEIVETSQLFARTLAGINPQWIVELAPHLCQVTHRHPHWSVTAGRVLAEEVITLYGLELIHRNVAYANLNPKDATAIFVRSALVEDRMFPEPEDEPERHDLKSDRVRPTGQELAAAAQLGRPRAEEAYTFLAANRKVREKIEDWQTRVRRHGLVDIDQALFNFYLRHLENVASIHELDRVLRGHPEPGFLCATEADLVGDLDLKYDAGAFPDSVQVGEQPVALTYAYAPGEEHDGVTVRLPVAMAEAASASVLEWAVPGLRAAKVEELLRSLPKSLRRELQPFPPKVAEIVQEFQPSRGGFLPELSRFIRQKYGVEVPVDAWSGDSVPAHLRTRVEFVDHERKVVSAGRDFAVLQAALPKPKVEPRGEHPAWLAAARRWEKFGLTAWSFGDLPDKVPVGEDRGLPLWGWLGLEEEGGKVNVRLFRAAEASRRSSVAGVGRLIEWVLQKDFGWLQKDLRGLAKLAPQAAGLGTLDEFQEAAFFNLRRQVLPTAPLPALTVAQFEAAVAATKARLPGLALQLQDRIQAVLNARQSVLARVGTPAVPASPQAKPKAQTLTDFRQLAVRPAAAIPSAAAPKAAVTAAAARPASSLASELAALVPPDFLRRIPFERLPHLPRYLKALQLRVERATSNPPKEQERARLLAPQAERLQRLAAGGLPVGGDPVAAEEFRWLVEEYKVSLFAQELGTAVPVSPARLDQCWARVEGR
jgi:ATP-dependent helicase HrpA